MHGWEEPSGEGLFLAWTVPIIWDKPDLNRKEPGSMAWQSDHILICSDGTSSHLALTEMSFRLLSLETKLCFQKWHSSCLGYSLVSANRAQQLRGFNSFTWDTPRLGFDQPIHTNRKANEFILSLSLSKRRENLGCELTSRDSIARDTVWYQPIPTNRKATRENLGCEITSHKPLSYSARTVWCNFGERGRVYAAWACFYACMRVCVSAENRRTV